MKLILWNSRGTCRPSFVRVARDIIREHHPVILAIVETRAFADRANQIVNKLGFSKAFVVDPVGFSGGLWLLWNPLFVDISCTSYSRWSIHDVVSLVNSPLSQPWLLSSVYGSPNHAIRQHLWAELEAVSCVWVWLVNFRRF